MEESLENVVATIRAVITSSKGPVTVRNLMCDYETLLGCQIPYQKLGYPNIESFLRKLPSLRVTGIGRDIMVEAEADRSSSHVIDLISKQKSSKKKESRPPSRRGYPQPRSSYERSKDRVLLHTSSNFQKSHEKEGAHDYHYKEQPERRVSNRYQNNTEMNENQYHSNKDRPERQIPPRFQKSNERGGPHDHHYSKDQPRGINLGSQNQSTMQESQKQYYKERVEPITVTFDRNERRQVSLGVDCENKFPLHTNEVSHQTTRKSPPIQEETKKDVKLWNDLNSEEPDYSSSIISPFGPGQLVAAGRAQQLAAQNEECLYDTMLSKNIELHSSLLSPQIKKIPVPTADQQNIGANVYLLEMYSKARNWPVPQYIVSQRKPKGGPWVYGAKVKILTCNQKAKECLSYPFEGENESIAKGYAAKKALEELIEEENVNLDNRIISRDKNLIFHRISSIVGDSPAGMFAKTVEDQYFDTYNEVLPEDWIKALSTCPTLSVEASLNSTIIVPKNLTVDSVFSQPQLSPGKITLQTASEDLPVYITCATSTCNVWCQLIGEEYSDKYFQLQEDMMAYYNLEDAEQLSLDIEVGQYYAVNLCGWKRVQVSKMIPETMEVNAFLIDHGESENFNLTSLYRLPPQFCSLPRQAIQIALENLESYDDDPVASEVVKTSLHLIDNTLRGVITYIDKKTDFVKMCLYNTNNKNDDININEVLLEDIIGLYSKAKPQLTNEGYAMNVNISSISKIGEFYIQIPGSSYVEDINNKLISHSEEISKYKLTSYRQVEINKIYLAKYSMDGNWYRAVVTAKPSMQQNKIAVQFIDFGNAETVSISDIAEVYEKLPPYIRLLPPQAVKVAMCNIGSLSCIEITKLHSMLMDEEKTVLIKTVSLQEDPPLVEIFYKNAKDNALVSVNNTIKLEQSMISEEEKKIDFGHNRAHVATSGGLQRPDLKGDFHTVLIVLAANPSNFIFQPLQYDKELASLMNTMQIYYENTTSADVPVKEVLKGQLYATQYLDKTWYRVIVTETNAPGSTEANVVARLCDYGDVTCVPVTNLRDLAEDFKKLPFMALKGRLAGIVPRYTDWSVDDCVRFQTLVLNNTLASIIVDIEENHIDPMETVASLHLVNTRDKLNHEVISEILINENRGVKVLTSNN